MKISFITITPSLIKSCFKNTILNKALENKNIKLEIINLRDFGKGKYKQIDDSPFGGGAGMVMMADPILKALDHSIKKMNIKSEDANVFYPTAQGKVWKQSEALNHINNENIIFICGRYKGIDQRITDNYVTHEYSIGDYVITNGEISSIVIADSIVRLIPGTLNNFESARTDSFYSDLLDSPHYTQPRNFQGREVPEILLSGHHKNINDWKNKQSKILTKIKRPDLWQKFKEINNENGVY